jgi:ArsR family transcriptional regulator, zinc-responsive transcriptional repressor
LADLPVPHDADLTNDLGTVAFLVKSLSDENRLRILLSLRSGPRTVSAIVEEMGLSQPLVSHHLKELRRSLLVRVERKGLFVYYEMADPRIIDIVQQLSRLANDLISTRNTF